MRPFKKKGTIVIKQNIKRTNLFIIWCRYDNGNFVLERPQRTSKLFIGFMRVFFTYIFSPFSPLKQLGVVSNLRNVIKNILQPVKFRTVTYTYIQVIAENKYCRWQICLLITNTYINTVNWYTL